MESVTLFERFCRNSLAVGDVDPAVSHLRYIVHRMEMNREQVLWLCFLYGITYQLPSAYLIWSEFPDLEILDMDRLRDFWAREQRQIPFQTDKMKQRRSLPDTVTSYRQMVGSSQARYFSETLGSDPHANFNTLWSPSQSLAYFGRFSIWNWAQLLKHVAGIPVDPPTLLIGEPESVSFTDGLAYAFGKPECVTKNKQRYRWTAAEKSWMEATAARVRVDLGVDNYELETLACAYKKVWRENDSRYVGYYHDRMAEDIRRLEENPRWDGVNWQLLWDARSACVPSAYRNDGVDKSLFTASPGIKIGVGHMKSTKQTRSVYIIGGAGTGKSTFMDALIADLGCQFGEYGPLYNGREASTGRSRTLCGHALLRKEGPPGVYVGNHRDWFPGSDGLDLVISPTAAEWLRTGDLPHFLVSEGAVLATPKFQVALREETNLLLLHLSAPREVVRERVQQRGSADRHGDEFLTRTVTRAENVRKEALKAGVKVLSIDSSKPEDWEDALDLAVTHLCA